MKVKSTIGWLSWLIGIVIGLFSTGLNRKTKQTCSWWTNRYQTETLCLQTRLGQRSISMNKFSLKHTEIYNTSKDFLVGTHSISRGIHLFREHTLILKWIIPILIYQMKHRFTLHVIMSNARNHVRWNNTSDTLIIITANKFPTR